MSHSPDISSANMPTANISNWAKHDMHWILSLFGTAVGAGILFLPINIGIGGITLSYVTWANTSCRLSQFRRTYVA
ncbi:Threonine/serine transporter TdcC [Pseudoalteromonas holothuriae]|uniref:Threonine/serine transporter TdcC n=1 Tax=Pseudoalteromonas holothuriae TaxID=2963714 RepID=A0A9W4W0Z1_9GAMM|nr:MULTISPECIES: hypothetical protein [unclassified Pseudoalteromonas]CAH9050897.1 Threonine/serine transporter TdcC [Pseudoalteromonas sp. CIP111854]CAH9059960.1 Threonine/serine transporter TdcC [Pseudoalteromonas sp. CIP111951]